MKNKTFTTLFFTIFFILMIHSQVSAQDGYGKVYFMRLPREGRRALLEEALNYCNVFIDSSFICKLDERRYFAINVPAGKHVFAMQLRGKKIKNSSKDIVVTIENGKTYYIQLVYTMYPKLTDMYCKLLAEDLANMILPDLKIDKSCVKE